MFVSQIFEFPRSCEVFINFSVMRPILQLFYEHDILLLLSTYKVILAYVILIPKMTFTLFSQLNYQAREPSLLLV